MERALPERFHGLRGEGDAGGESSQRHINALPSGSCASAARIVPLNLEKWTFTVCLSACCFYRPPVKVAS